jgi:hypothetical protein
MLPGKSTEESNKFAATNDGLSIKNKKDKIIYFPSNMYEIILQYHTQLCLYMFVA